MKEDSTNINTLGCFNTWLRKGKSRGRNFWLHLSVEIWKEKYFLKWHNRIIKDNKGMNTIALKLISKRDIMEWLNILEVD